jgi:hypothetical protein
MSRPQMHTPIPKYEAGLGYVIYTGKGAEMLRGHRRELWREWS